MCDVPSIAVFCSESIECFPGTVSKFFFFFFLLLLLLLLLLLPGVSQSTEWLVTVWTISV